MDFFDLFVEMWKVFLNWCRTTPITIGRFSFTFMEFWIWCVVAVIIISFIVSRIDN